MKFRHLIPVVIAMFIATPLLAEVSTEIELVRKLIHTEKKVAIAEAMELEEEMAQKFWPIYNDYQNELRKVKDRRVKLIRDLAENFETLDDAKAIELLDEALKFETEQLKLKKTYVKKFRKALPGKTVAKYFQAENKVETIINFGLSMEIPLID